jgi:hypothetical protein
MRKAIYAASVLVVAGLAAGRAFSVPQGAQQRACIDTMNGNSVRVGKAEAKQIAACVRDGSRSKLGSLPLVNELESCFLADPRNRVFAAMQSALGKEQGRCEPNFLPSFATPDIGALYDVVSNNYSSIVNLTALKTQLTLTHDVIGFPAEPALANYDTNRDAATCQYQMLRTVLKCLEAKGKAFNTCKKFGLRDQTIGDAAALETQCLMQGGDAATGQPDPTGRLLKNCDEKFAKVIARKCAGVNTNTVFPGSCVGSGKPACFGNRVDCRLCQQLNRTDHLNRDCDLFDDGVDNESCANVLPNCGDGFLDSPEEQCDDGNTDDGDCCSATCQFEFNGSSCGDGGSSECSVPDTCDGAGTCLDNHATAGSACGDPSATDCTAADACDGNGACLDNHTSSGASCGDPSATECTSPDTCDGSGACLDNHTSAGAACGDPADTQCTDADTCDGSGSCQDNHAGAGAACGDGTDNDCTDADTCDGAGTCQDNHAGAGVACGDPADTDCTNPDLCDGSGTCQPNHATPGSSCTDDGNDCTSDQCDAGGTCQHASLPNGSACGNPADTDCTNPDSCNGGACQPNHAGAGATCASDGIECTDDLCNGSGSCTHPNKTSGTPCTNDGLECTNDICNGGGTCTHPNKTLGTACTSDGNPCTNDQCNGAGACAHPHNSAPCNDNIFCNGPDSCSGGACTVHAGTPCPGTDGDNNCAESCNEAADNCLAQDPNGSFCNDGQSCNGADACSGGICVPSGVCCGTQNFTFTVDSNNGGAFDGAEWPGGNTSQSSSPGCSVTIRRPNGDVDLVCTLADDFGVVGSSGFQNCFGTGGEDGDGCQPVYCPPLGIGSCCDTRPSCSAALNGGARAQYFVQCVDP